MSVSVARRRTGASVAAALAVVLSVASCGGGGGDAPKASATEAARTEAALRTCQKVFGAKNVDSLRAEFGEGLRAYDRSLTDMKERLVTEAHDWTAVDDDLRRATYRPCQIQERAEGSDGWVTSTVAWSMWSIEFLSSTKDVRAWHKVVDGVYVSPRRPTTGTSLAMTCTIPGSAAGQGSGLPLEVSVNEEDRKAGEGASTEQLLKSLAENMREFIGCREKPALPDDLAP
ncbi:hypothetical protein EDD98_1619 [Streptomyces sp. PanSC19]|uniref:hypothetical protein n=1 Tax=Streptomyces sp. PanSC19 TaxID=1520455 RepID=UPI000F470ADD|nr:hypothetical protein [Streptomyces sp. PanSC19]ROQ32627.1 hypothetical protein EDD98_1619 [Streptomyces sp. PanSC19]